MARIGKCRKCKKDWVVLGTYADWKNQCDGVGFCKECFTEHRLEMKGESKNYTIMEDWQLNTEKADKTCTTKHVIPPKSKDSGILPNLT